jgi:hypothetical protein
MRSQYQVKHELELDGNTTEKPERPACAFMCHHPNKQTSNKKTRSSQKNV